ncbi:TSUP family transporter [Halomonas elongata]|uniref:Probable membrane transporter protein n=2 Tax=Halomonas elongata TaxID=2746 RepID=E1V6K1_HALED|nr:TSUP family transporter [Halomonas elongata]MDL4861159.1 TSUP family transporter [Halomonas elongata]OBX37927.1 sulfite exporter TauE/SafE [Halomonas elongata]RAW06361.1 permease [Halomonas elongata]WBF18563.1 TSUP family transporter [Halomonas elongata]WPU47417.1 TSUP family transporter [Halomonas elongata DSM 2581]
MAELEWYQYALIGLIFAWSGFVRTSLGFGGAVLALPFLLLVLDEPLVFLPIVAIHLLIFSSWIAWRGHRQARADDAGARDGGNIDWAYLFRALKIMIVPKLIGVVGLLTLPGNIMSIIIFVIVLVYGTSYLLNRPFRSQNKAVDCVLLGLGGYVSGTSLIGAPLIVSVFASHVAKHQLRDTLFVLWFILVAIKMVSFVIAGVDLQLIHQLWLLPCALAGHLLGERAHRYMLSAGSGVFFRVLGGVLILVSVIGLISGAG